MKTAELAEGLVYATKERLSGTAYPGLLLEKGMWREKDEWANWDGAEKRTRARIVRKAPQGARAESWRGWGRDYQKTGLPVLVLKATEWDFTEGARDNQIAESPLEILERARDNMNIMSLVAEDYDGRITSAQRASLTIRVRTVKGAARKVEVRMELMRPQQVIGQWGPYAKQEAREREEREAIAKALAEASAQSTAQAQDFVTRLNALVGEKEGPKQSQGERYDFHRKWTSGNNSSTYEVSAEIIEQLLTLAEKGASA